jgi:hypothetical protein
MRAYAERGDWARVADSLERTGDLAERGLCCLAVAEWPGRPAWLDAWVDARGERSSLPWLVRGAHSVEWAWEARTGARASEVAKDSWPVFFSRLSEAQRDLERAAEMDPRDPAPYGRLVITAMGLQSGIEEVEGLFEAACLRDPTHFPTHRDTLTALTDKWGGSHEEMFAFARRAAAARADSGLASLVAAAHVERWLKYHMDGDPDGGRAYANDREVVREIRQAWAGSFGMAPAAGGLWTAAARNLFAFAFWLFGAKREARRELEALRGILTEVPWCYLDVQATRAFDKAREGCGLL